MAIFLSVVVFSACKKSATPSVPQEFSFNNGAEPESLDPHKVSTVDAFQHLLSLYEPLVTKDETFLALRPGLAESWTNNEARTEYTFTLRPNLKWSNGEPLTAEQVRGSLIRAMNPRVALPYIQYYQDFIQGAAELIKGYDSPQRKEIEAALGIQVVNGNQILFKLRQPVPLFADYLASQAFMVVHPSMYDPEAKAWRTPSEFIGNGAFVLKEWNVNNRIVMEKNPHYHDAANVRLERIIAYAVNDRQTTLNMYRQKQLDWTGENRIPDSVVPQVSSQKDFHRVAAFGTYMYMFNTKRKPLDDKRVRRALLLAIDRDTVATKVLRDGKVPTHYYVPPGIPGYVRPELKSTDLAANITEAKKLLADAGFPGGKGFPSLTLLYNTDEGHHRIAQAIQQMWLQNLGVRVELQNREWKVFISETQAKNFDIARRGWIGDLPDPAVFMEAFLSNSDNNEPQYRNPEYDRLVRLSSQAVDSKQRMELARQAEALLLEDAPIAPIYHYVFYSLMSPEVEGFIPNLAGQYLFRYFRKKT